MASLMWTEPEPVGCLLCVEGQASMLNINVAGTVLSTYYLADPALFLRDQRDRGGLRMRRRVYGMPAGNCEGWPPTLTRRARWDRPAAGSSVGWRFGWRFPARPATLDEPITGCDEHDSGRAWVLVTPPGQNLDTSPTGRRAGKLRPQRQAEVCARSGTLPAVLLTNGSELRVIRRDPGLGGESSYLSVDLAGLAELGDEHEWRVIWALLRPEAFAPDEAGESLWDALEKASAEAAETVSEDLSDGVRIAITAIANGALADLRRRGHPSLSRGTCSPTRCASPTGCCSSPTPKTAVSCPPGPPPTTAATRCAPCAIWPLTRRSSGNPTADTSGERCGPSG